MENCLVTKLKGTVDNDNLPILGEMRIEVIDVPVATSNNILSISSLVNQKLTILTSGVTFGGGGTELSLVGGNNPIGFTVTGPCVISIENKYKINRFGQGTNGPRIRLSINDWKYSSLTDIQVSVDDASNNNDITGDIANLPASITDFRVKRSKITGDIRNLPNNIEAIVITSNNNITGNLNTLHSNILRIVNFSGSQNLIGCIEDVCQNTINAGKDSGNGEFYTNEKFKVVNTAVGNGRRYYITYSGTGCTIGTTSGGNDVATCVKSGTAGSYTFTWTDGNGNTYVPTY